MYWFAILETLYAVFKSQSPASNIQENTVPDRNEGIPLANNVKFPAGLTWITPDLGNGRYMFVRFHTKCGYYSNRWSTLLSLKLNAGASSPRHNALKMAKILELSFEPYWTILEVLKIPWGIPLLSSLFCWYCFNTQMSGDCVCMWDFKKKQKQILALFYVGLLVLLLVPMVFFYLRPPVV